MIQSFGCATLLGVLSFGFLKTTCWQQVAAGLEREKWLFEGFLQRFVVLVSAADRLEKEKGVVETFPSTFTATL